MVQLVWLDKCAFVSLIRPSVLICVRNTVDIIYTYLTFIVRIMVLYSVVRTEEAYEKQVP